MKKYLLVFIGILAIYDMRESWVHRKFRQPDGILVSEEPQQNLLPHGKPFRFQEHTLRPLAEYNIRARLISQENYRFDDGSVISPIDLCVGWGHLSDNRVLDQLRHNQNNRFCYYEWSNNPPIDLDTIIKSQSNIHIIPENDLVRKMIKKLRPGQILNMQGQLVEFIDRNGGTWMSSLSREDKGRGACELMLVKNIYIE